MNNIELLKKHELIVLDEFIRICDKYKFKYYLGCGSAIGAIRHKGFIPWDDDIDIHMPCDDMLRFKEICKKELSHKYYYQDKLNDKYYYNFWPKFGLEDTTWMPKDRIVDCKYGVCIDIFPLFPFKNNPQNKRRIEFNIKLMYITSAKYYVLNTKTKKYSLFKKMIHRIVPNFITNYIYKKVINNLCRDKDDYDQFVFPDITTDKNYYYDKDVFLGNRTMKFENRQVAVPNKIEVYLSDLFGDYMTPPPINERYGHDKGDEIIYDFKNSYQKYLGDKNDKS